MNDKTYDIPFIRYTLPNGHRTGEIFECTDETTYKQSQALLAEGYTFSVEILRTGQVSFTTQDTRDDDRGDISIKIVNNGPAVVDAICNMIDEVYKRELDENGKRKG